MEKRDYLESQIEQLSLVLSNIIGFLTGKKTSGLETPEQFAEQQLKAELGFDTDEITDMPNEELLEKLTATGKFNNSNYEKLADVLHLLGEQQLKEGNESEARTLLNKALMLYTYLEANGGDYSFYRNSRIAAIKKIYQNCSVIK